MNVNDYLDIFAGKVVLITWSVIADTILYYRELFDREIQNDWLIALKMDFKCILHLMNRHHPMKDQISKWILNSRHDYEIAVRTERLAKHGWLLYYYVAEGFVEKNVIEEVRNKTGETNFHCFEKNVIEEVRNKTGETNFHCFEKNAFRKCDQL